MPDAPDDASPPDRPNDAPAPSPPPVPTVPPDFRTGDVAVVLVVVLLPAVVSAFTDLAWPKSVPKHPPVGAFELNSLAVLAGWAGLVRFLIDRSGHPAARFGLVRPALTDVPVAGVLLFLTWQIGGYLGRAFDGLPGAEVNGWDQFPPPPVTAWEVALTVVGAFAVGGVEELVWRAYLLTRVEEVAGSAGPALLLTSGLFGLAHLYQGPSGVLNTGAIGLLYGGAFLLTRRVWPVAAAHGAYDLILMLQR